MNRQHIRFSVSFARVLGGLALIAGAAGVAAASAFSDAIPAADAGSWSLALLATWTVLVIAPTAGLVSGSALLFQSVTERCDECDRELIATRARFAGEGYEALAFAIEREPSRVLELAEGLPPPRPSPAAVLEVECEVCPLCLRVGRIAASRLAWHADRGQYEPERRVGFVEVDGRPMERLAKLIDRRATSTLPAEKACER